MSELSAQDRAIAAGTRVGVVGGGQLGLMLGEAAAGMGFAAFTVLDPTPCAPAQPVATRQITGAFRDEAAIRELGEASDVLTFEIELAGSAALEELERAGKAVLPAPRVLATIQDKLTQKTFLRAHGLPVADFELVENAEQIARAAELFGYPLVLKARRDAYDGRGNAVLTGPGDIVPALQRLADRELYVERFVPFTMELAVMAARARDGAVACHPVVETRHVRNICDAVLCPAPVPEETRQRAEALATGVVRAFDSAGIFGVEMFLTADGELLVNEVAPRPHNSGHHTIEACETSQFEQHLRAVCGLALGETSLKAPAAVMINILGERDGPAAPRGIAEVEALGAHVHVYGKRETRVDRKMGHLTVLGATLEQAYETARRARAMISI